LVSVASGSTSLYQMFDAQQAIENFRPSQHGKYHFVERKTEKKSCTTDHPIKPSALTPFLSH
jgi:hypothetical protein